MSFIDITVMSSQPLALTNKIRIRFVLPSLYIRHKDALYEFLF